MNSATAIASLDRALAGYGQEVVLQHTAVDAAGDVSVTDSVQCPAKVRQFGPQDLEAGGVVEIQVIVSPTGLGAFGLPSRDDRIMIAGNPSNIVQVAPLYYGGELVRVNLLCRG